MVKFEANPNPSRFMLPRVLIHCKPDHLVRFLALLLSAAAVSCGESALFSDSPSSSVTLPYETTVRDDQGRSLDINLIFRTDNSIHFVRKSDKREFDLPIARLSEADQRWITKLPVSTAASRATAEREKYKHAYIKNRQEAIGRVEEQIQKLADEVGSGNITNSQIRNNNREMERKREEIRDIEAQINDYEKR